MYKAREKMMNSFSYVDFAKLCMVIKYSPQLNMFLVKKTLIYLSNQAQYTLYGRKS